jgi:3-dehydroquinate synthase
LSRLQVRTNARKQKYEILIGQAVLSEAGTVARAQLGPFARRIVLVSNQTVFALYGSRVVRNLETSGFVVSTSLLAEGERFKSLKTAEKLVHFFHEMQLERGDAIVSLGGGVVGDIAGFAAAIYLRGVPFLQIPTTLLAQIDSSVGGKTGVNLPGGKNLIGSFHQPSAVLIDIETLATLPSRERVAGWCECVKQGAVSSRKLFSQTTGYLQVSGTNALSSSPQLEQLIAAHCSFKAAIVAQDEREDTTRTDHRSRRILNFGHTVAHALESTTNYQRFRHGEAVGHGMLVAGAISKNLGLLDESELELLTQAVRLCGPLPPVKDLDELAIIDAIAHDKKRSAGQVQWVLLERIGRPRIVNGKEISGTLLRKSLRQIFQTR